MSNPIQRFFGFLTSPSHSRTTSILAILIIALAIPLTVIVAQKQQDLRQHAATGATCDTNDICTGWSYDKCFVAERLPCGETGGNGICTAGTCVYGNGGITHHEFDSYCGMEGYHPACAGFSKGFYECLPGSASEMNAKVAQCPASTPPPVATPPPASTPPPTATTVPVTCPSIVVNGTDYGGSCSSNSPNKTVASCTTTTHSCPSGPVPGHTLAACVSNGTGFCYAYNPSECWPDNPCPAAAPAAPTTCTTFPISWGVVCSLPTSPVKSTNTTATPACKGPTHPDNDCPPCDNYTKDPVCTQYPAGTLAFKQQSDGSWYCGDTTARQYLGFATCGVAAAPPAALPDCTQSTGTCQAAANSCNITNGTWTLDKLTNGSTNCTRKPNTPCTLPSPITTCVSPNVCNSSNQCGTPPAGNSQTCTVVPTCSGGSPITSNGTTWTCSNGITPVCTNTAGSTIIALNANLHGLGSVGDAKNIQQKQVFYTPKRSRSMVVQLFDSANTLIKTTTGSLGYNPSSGQFLGTTINLGTINGTYTVKIKPDGYLQRTFTNVTVNSGVTTTLSVNPTFIAANINNINNTVGPLDYGIFLSCSIFSTDSGALCNQNPNYRIWSDFNDDGAIDQIDYNLLLREFGSVGEN